jgi:triacylglycerol lipase
VARGGGAPILLVPGFGAPGRVVAPLHGWLARLGYVPRVADVHRGLDCSERTAVDLERQLEEFAAKLSSPVLIVAHSRGGQFARVAARRRPDLTAGLITLGTPFELLALHPAVKAQAAILGVAGTAGIPNLVRLACARGRCCAAFRRDLSTPWPRHIPFASIYSRADRTVRWQACADDGADNIEITASHAGMLVSRESYEVIARFAADVTTGKRSISATSSARQAAVHARE